MFSDSKRWPVIIALLLLGAALAACNGSGGTAGKSAVTDACQVLTQADAQAALGGPVKAPEKPISGEGIAVVTSCKYSTAAGTGVDNVTLIMRRLDTPAATQQDFDQMKRDMVSKVSVTPEDIANLGDGAFWADGAINQLAVRKGQVQLLILVHGPAGTDPQAAAKTLALKALNRLP
jgi:hypothetical protein